MLFLFWIVWDDWPEENCVLASHKNEILREKPGFGFNFTCWLWYLLLKLILLVFSVKFKHNKAVNKSNLRKYSDFFSYQAVFFKMELAGNVLSP